MGCVDIGKQMKGGSFLNTFLIQAETMLEIRTKRIG
jgi:hypothetical protein